MKNWNNNDIQFPRLIAEIQTAGGFTSHIMRELSEAMDLPQQDIAELIDRAIYKWETIKNGN